MGKRAPAVSCKPTTGNLTHASSTWTSRNHPLKSQPTRDQPQPAVCGFGKTSKNNEKLRRFGTVFGSGGMFLGAKIFLTKRPKLEKIRPLQTEWNWKTIRLPIEMLIFQGLQYVELPGGRYILHVICRWMDFR